jgi:hypothetical protein
MIGMSAGLLTIGTAITDTGIGTEAECLFQERLQGIVESSSVSAQEQKSVLLDLYDAARTAAEPNWDGEGAAPVQQSTIRYAAQFIFSLPQGFEVPGVAIDRDGDAVFDWSRGAYAFSVSVGRDGSKTYAGVFGAAHTHGREPLTGGLSPNVLLGIHRVAVGT